MKQLRITNYGLLMGRGDGVRRWGLGVLVGVVLVLGGGDAGAQGWLGRGARGVEREAGSGVAADSGVRDGRVEGQAQAVRLSGEDLDWIGTRVWRNECGGTVAGLTSWNSGEDFPSLGIGHFIWYPVGRTGPFAESFPPMVRSLVRQGVEVPRWIREARGCPWGSRSEFLKAKDDPKMRELRTLLAGTVREQTVAILERLDGTLPRLEAAAGRDGKRVAETVRALRGTRAGTFALVDYVNFKGDGMDARERYAGEGWGLLQVLLAMDPAGGGTDAARAPKEFARASAEVLRRRVELSPPARGEKTWLDGWVARCGRYGAGR